jgi:hypothetical protein
MARIALIFLATALLAGCERPAGPADLVVVAGQSNALGFRLSGEDLPPDLRQGDPQVRIWTGQRFETLRPGRNTGSPNNPAAWGPEVGFARAWRAAHPDRTLYVVKLARGSTRLAGGPGPDWAPGSGELFADTESEVRKARRRLTDAGLTPRVRAILWMQGESDAVQPQAAAAYRANLAAAVAQMRARWGEADTPVLIGRIAPGWPQAAQVRAAQAAVDAADPLTASVDTAAYPLLPDGAHYAAAGQLRLGAELYRALPP